MFQHANVRFHPGMLITLHRDQYLRTGKGLLDRTSAVRLGLVPFRIAPWRWVNVVLSRIAVSDRQFLVGLEPQYVRHVLTPFLIERDRGGWCGKSEVGDLLAIGRGTVLDVHKGISELAVLNNRVLCSQVWIRLTASGIGRRVDFLRRRRCTVIGDGSGHAGISRRIRYS